MIGLDSVSPPHLLYVAWGYPPSRGAGMYRARATANAFVAAGWKVTVLTATRETFERLTGTDPLAEATIDPRISVVRAPFDLSRGEPDLALWTRDRVRSPLWWSFRKSIRDRVAFPEPTYGGWKGALIEATQRIHSESPVSLVIGSANPNVDFVPGQYLGDRYRVPYVMDYRDTWHLNVYTGQRTASPRSRSVRLERRLLAGAREAWFVNQPILDWHAEQYPENAADFHVVANGFDSDMLEAEHPRLPDAARGLVFGYLGTIYGPMPLRETFLAWRLARTRSSLIARSRMVIRGNLGHYSTPDAGTAALLQEFSEDGISYGGPVSKSDVSEVYRSFDLLLLILGKSRYVTSGKVFEYGATGLPIVSLHDPETASTTTLQGHPTWTATPDLTVEGIAQTLIRAGEAGANLSAEDIREAQAWAAPLSRDHQLAPRIAELTRFVTEARP